MASKLDNDWEHAIPVGGDRKKCKYNYCGKVVHGGITRLKQHIAHVSENVEACSKVPSEIRKMEDRLYGDIPNINVDSSDEDNDGIDEYGMSSLERKQLKQAMAESLYTGYVEDELRRNPSRAQWWYNYGDEAPNLRKIVVKVLSQTCASSGCERNWSTWSLIHTKLRNRLATEKLHKLVYAHYNMQLRVRNLMYQREDGDYYNPIDLNHIFHDNDILEEWTREAEEPLLPENDLDWLDEEGRMDNVPNDEDDDVSLLLSRWSVPRSSKGKDYPSQCDDSQSQRYGIRQPNIQYSMQNLEIDEHRPHQMHGHQGSSTGTNSGRSKTRRRNRGSATDSIGESNQRSSIETSHSSGTGTYSQGFGYYNQHMEHLMPSQPLPHVPYNIPYQGVFPQVPYGLSSQPVMYFPYEIPSHPAGVINVGSCTTPYTHNYSPTSHDYYRRIDGDGDGDDHFEPHRHSTFFKLCMYILSTFIINFIDV
ncbi:UNVERIFIED_CONTAM: hypothetical protein Sangu_2751200 [Sesamum angustifolium]|uniref:HAT C-terminal dimerisation domain-containing protein n=1 Tax=Sesamum angustifolium TaxID=2727405 RepID=A0AAW2IV50_9LAMI